MYTRLGSSRQKSVSDASTTVDSFELPDPYHCQITVNIEAVPPAAESSRGDPRPCFNGENGDIGIMKTTDVSIRYSLDERISNRQ